MIFENTIQIDKKNIYTNEIIKSTYYEDLVHYKFDDKIFSDVRNKGKLIQILTFKSGIFLYVKIPRFLYVSDFTMTYWLDEKLANVLGVKSFKTYDFISDDNSVTMEFLLKEFAVKINKSKEELLKDLKVFDDTGKEETLSSKPTIKIYEYIEKPYMANPHNVSGNLSTVDEMKIRIERSEDLSHIFLDYNTRTERNGILYKEFHKNKSTDKLEFALCGGQLVYYEGVH